MLADNNIVMGWDDRPGVDLGESLGKPGTVRRAHLLQFAQLALLVLLGLVAIMGAWWQSRAIADAGERVKATQSSLVAVESLNNAMLRQDRDFFRDRDEGGSGLTPGIAAFVVTGPQMLRQALAANVDHSVAQGKIERDLVATTDELAKLVGGFVQVTPHSAEDRELLAKTTPLVTKLHRLGDQLVTLQEQATADAVHDSRVISERWTEYMIVLLSFIVAIGSCVWWMLARARSRLVSALEHAAAQLLARATSDQLTGLPGHAAFHEALAAAVSEARHYGRDLSFVLFDLDHFKLINDTFGHPVGDEVLKQVARLACDLAREGEIVARVGGEEFAWLLPQTDADNAFRAGERLREAIASQPVADVPLTISVGVCDLKAAATPAELYRLTDGALYWAKAHGRNITFRYSPDVVEELSASERAERLERSLAVTTVRALARAVDAKDPTTQRHSERVSDLARALALELGWSETRATMLYEAGLVHDVGKIGVPDAILFKPGRLDEAEFEQVKAHSALGAQMVAGVLSDEQVGWVRGHHEKMDGSGYPDALAGDAIPTGARILALADAWDAMTSARPYSKPFSEAEALDEARRHSGTQFWSPAVEALERLVISARMPHGTGHVERYAAVSL